MDEQELTKIVLDWSTAFLRISMHDISRYSRETGLSLIEMSVLLHLYYNSPLEVMNFTGLMQLSPAGASQLVERLVQQGLALREESPDDRRVRLVHLTEAGKKIIADTIASRQKWAENLMDSFDTEQKEAVARALLLLTEKAVQLDIREAANPS
jgi:DNA-binding MarR family transcriptional regulator